MAVIVVYPPRYIPTYDAARGRGSSSDGFASRPILRSRAATQENGKDNPKQQSVLVHEVTLPQFMPMFISLDPICFQKGFNQENPNFAFVFP